MTGAVDNLHAHGDTVADALSDRAEVFELLRAAAEMSDLFEGVA